MPPGPALHSRHANEHAQTVMASSAFKTCLLAFTDIDGKLCT